MSHPADYGQAGNIKSSKAVMMDLYLEITIPVLFQSVTANISTTKAVLEQVVTQTDWQEFLLVSAPMQIGQRIVAIHFLS